MFCIGTIISCIALGFRYGSLKAFFHLLEERRLINLRINKLIQKQHKLILRQQTEHKRRLSALKLDSNSDSSENSNNKKNNDDSDTSDSLSDLYNQNTLIIESNENEHPFAAALRKSRVSSISNLYKENNSVFPEPGVITANDITENN